MAGDLISLLSGMFAPQRTNQITAPIATPVSRNPYGNNPFVNYNGNTLSSNYGKNKPVRGGYFAGYYNGKQNIVGQRLFIEV
ncbi:hypothetical protein IJF81_05835 [bacterium]|nr:hypothetical protein [bacterium]